MAIKFVLKQNPAQTSATGNSLTTEFPFNGSLFTVGSDAANDLIAPGSAAEQFVIVPEEEHLMLINNAEGTTINNQTLRREALHPLATGDEIRFAGYILTVVDDEPNVPAAIPSEDFEQLPNPNIYATVRDVSEVLGDEKSKFEELLAKPSAPPAPRNFADVLDALRTEEDSFYFVVKNGADEVGRIMLSEAETPIGINAKSELVFTNEQIATLYGLARKDWSGILIESQKRNAIFVNDETIETTRRLRNDDRLSFTLPSKISLALHEPSSLVALESLLSARGAENGSRFGGLAANREGAMETVQPAAVTEPKVSLFERRFFGFFSLLEIVTMIIGTLIGAVLFFLFFEFMFS